MVWAPRDIVEGRRDSMEGRRDRTEGRRDSSVRELLLSEELLGVELRRHEPLPRLPLSDLELLELVRNLGLQCPHFP